MAKKEYYGRGKLLLTGEYAVVNGARALALPTRKGQKLTVSTGRGSDIKWKSLTPDGETWFTAKISLFDFSALKSSDAAIAEKLEKILEAAVRLNSDFLSTWKGIKVTTELEFPQEWGWGSSSTLVYNIAQWADVDPYDLYAATFGGSGYDIACAGAKGPLLYHKVSDQLVDVRSASIDKSLQKHLYFIYSGQKAESREALEYLKEHTMDDSLVEEVSSISSNLSESSKVEDWVKGIESHNALLTDYLKRDCPAAAFSDFQGAVKALGAWGGDFLLAVSPESPSYVKSYFSEKAMTEVLTYADVALS